MQALRGVISAAGDKMSDAVVKQVHSSLLSLLANPEDLTRSGAAGCLGALVRSLTPEQLAVTLNDHLLRTYYFFVLIISYLTIQEICYNQFFKRRPSFCSKIHSI